MLPSIYLVLGSIAIAFVILWIPITYLIMRCKQTFSPSKSDICRSCNHKHHDSHCQAFIYQPTVDVIQYYAPKKVPTGRYYNSIEIIDDVYEIKSKQVRGPDQYIACLCDHCNCYLYSITFSNHFISFSFLIWIPLLLSSIIVVLIFYFPIYLPYLVLSLIFLVAIILIVNFFAFLKN